jgi:hypothetical protein
MVIWLLSVCLAVAVVAYVRVKYPRRTTQTPQVQNSISTGTSEEILCEGEADSSEFKSNDTPVDEALSSESHGNCQPQAPDDGPEDAEESSVPRGSRIAIAPVVPGDENCTEEKQIKSRVQKRSPNPEARGGRPRGRSETCETEQEQEPEGGLHISKPEIVCWKRQREWILGVEISDEQRAGREISVLQNGTPLTEDGLEHGRWLLMATRGQVVAQPCGGGETQSEIVFGEDNHLLFRLSGDSLSQGRRVRRASSGSYLVIVSEDWERDEMRAGIAPAAPEPVCLEGYLAHFFELSDGPSANIAFHDRSGNAWVITARGPRFHLVGHQICDASEGLGPLFGGSPPHVCVSDGSWKDVGAMVIGEEGRGKGKWRMRFDPNHAVAEQGLPTEIVERKAGWYFVRFYGPRGELIDSLDFRFVAGLHGITVRDVTPLPSTEGHKQAVVDFDHEQGCQIEPSMSHCEDLVIERQAEMTTGIIPASPEFDRSHWLISGINSPEIRITVLLERVWWVLGDKHQSDLAWQDRRLPCTRNDFTALSNKIIFLRLPQRGWAESVRIGFTKASARQYHTRVNDPALAIPLRGFGDSPEISTVGAFPFMLYVNLAGATYEAPLCTLFVNAGCKFDAFTAVSEDELFSHVGSLHLSEFFRPLTYKELREREPNLPAAIYQCSYNPCHYVRTDDLQNPTMAIIAHITTECDDARQQTPWGPIKIQFRVLDDVDEIERSLSINLPNVQKCKLCSGEFKNAGQETLLAHLKSKHESSCFELR